VGRSRKSVSAPFFMEYNMIDFHIHPDYSQDAEDSARDIVLAAIERKLEAICFTTHIDLNPNRACLDAFLGKNGRLIRFSNDRINEYVNEIEGLTEKYRGEIEILMGFEISYGGHFEEKISEFLHRWKPQFALGAIHCLENMAITANSEATGYFRSKTAEQVAEQFCNALLELVDYGEFKTIAHIDGIKKYARAVYGEKIDRELERKMPEVFNKMAEKQIGIEINTSALRKGHPDLYPSKNILEMAREAGVKVNSVGSDAHRTGDVGASIERAYRLIEEVGIEVGEPLAGYLR